MITPFALGAEGFRVATLHAELTRKGPGLLLRDIERGKDTQIAALKEVNTAVRPDILLLTKVDFDLEQRTSEALKTALGYHHFIAVKPNSMIPTEHDLDGDGRAGDRQAWARYAGEGGMVLLSQHPMTLQFHLGDLLWKDVDHSGMAFTALGDAFPSKIAHDVQKLVSQGLWVVKVQPQRAPPLMIVAFQNQTPIFDGPEDLNGLRNRAQLKLLDAVMAGDYDIFPNTHFVLIGNANLDPERGAGDRKAISDLLSNKRLQDPMPQSELGGNATVVWEKAGPMRVSYILPSADWSVEASKVVWPREGPLRQVAERASRHRMIWMDLTPPTE